MSSFHILKYQISTPPTIRELKDLPSEIYKDWVLSAFFLSPDIFPPTMAALAMDIAYNQHSTAAVHRHAEGKIVILRNLLKDAE